MKTIKTKKTPKKKMNKQKATMDLIELLSKIDPIKTKPEHCQALLYMAVTFSKEILKND